MPTIRKRVGAKGTRFQAIIRRHRRSAPRYRESQTFGTRDDAERWAKEREDALNNPAANVHAPHSGGGPCLAALIRWYINAFSHLTPWGRTKRQSISSAFTGACKVKRQSRREDRPLPLSVLPLDQCYPKENTELQLRIACEQLLISQFPAGHPVAPENFPTRNRTMALLTDATVIVEAGEKSGALFQGWEALRLGRLLFLLENVATHPTLSWPKQLIHYGPGPLTRQPGHRARESAGVHDRDYHCFRYLSASNSGYI